MFWSFQKKQILSRIISLYLLGCWSHIRHYLTASKWRNHCYCSNQQVAPQAAKTMSPPFTPMGGFGGGSSNTFSQMPTGAAPMPTGAAPTPTSSANYTQINARASLNNNSFGRSCAYSVWVSVTLVSLVSNLTLLCFVPDGAQSGAQFPSRAAEAVWPQWQGQQHSQSNSEQGNQQDMFPVSDAAHSISKGVLAAYLVTLKIHLFLLFDSGCVVHVGPAFQLQQRRLWYSYVYAI